MKKRNVTSRNPGKRLSGKVFTSHMPAREKSMHPVKVTTVIFHLALSNKDAMWGKKFTDLAFCDTLLWFVCSLHGKIHIDVETFVQVCACVPAVWMVRQFPSSHQYIRKKGYKVGICSLLNYSYKLENRISLGNKAVLRNCPFTATVETYCQQWDFVAGWMKL